MNLKYFSQSAKLGVLAVVLSYGASLHASTTPVAPESNDPVQNQHEVQVAAFNNSSEAAMLHRAYRILATGDHDYKGYRVKAMHSVEAAAKLLGMDLKGDTKDREPQVLSDAKLREASSLISNVLASAAVKDQKRVTKHLNEAIHHIQSALGTK